MGAALQNGVRRIWGASSHAVQADDGTWYYLFQNRNGGLAAIVHVLPDGRQESVPTSGQTTRVGLAFFNDGRIGGVAGRDGDDSTLPDIIPIANLFRQFRTSAGPAGPQGATGPAGPKGDKGDPGMPGGGGAVDPYVERVRTAAAAFWLAVRDWLWGPRGM